MCKASIPRSDGTAGKGSVYRSVFGSASTQETSVAVPWKRTCHVTPPSCQQSTAAHENGIKSISGQKRRRKRPHLGATSERCNSHKLTSFQASKCLGKATGTVSVRFASVY